MIAWTIEELEARLRNLRPGSGREVLIDGPNEDGVKLYRIFTAAHAYRISAAPVSNDHPTGYLGCVFTCRAADPGEGWARGSDLPDGPFTEAVWLSILRAIVGNELAPVSPLAWPYALDPAPSPQPMGGPSLDTPPANDGVTQRQMN